MKCPIDFSDTFLLGRFFLFQIAQVASSNEDLVDVLSVALPRIIPNVLLNKREVSSFSVLHRRIAEILYF